MDDDQPVYYLIATDDTRFRVDEAVYRRGKDYTWNVSQEGCVRARIGKRVITLGRFVTQENREEMQVHRIEPRLQRDLAGNDYYDFRRSNLAVHHRSAPRPHPTPTDWKARALAAEARLVALEGQTR